MKYLLSLLMISVAPFICCSQRKAPEEAELKNKRGKPISSTDKQHQRKIINALSGCVPANWQVRERITDSEKLSLAHIHKGEFELHFQVKYTVLDTVLAKQLNKPKNHRYTPKLDLHFYPNDESLKKRARFVQEHQNIISSLFLPHDFAETKNYLVYASTPENAFQEVDSEAQQLRLCLKSKLRYY